MVRKTTGIELLRPFTMSKSGLSPEGWNLFSAGKTTCKGEENGVISCGVTDKKTTLMLTSQVKLAPGKSYRFAFDVQLPQGASLTPSIRWTKSNISGKTRKTTAWQSCVLDFSVPAGIRQGVLGLWCGGLQPGKSFKLRNLSLKELAP